MDREVMHLRDSLIQRHAEILYYCCWYSPERLVRSTRSSRNDQALRCLAVMPLTNHFSLAQSKPRELCRATDE